MQSLINQNKVQDHEEEVVLVKEKEKKPPDSAKKGKLHSDEKEILDTLREMNEQAKIRDEKRMDI